MCLVRTADSDIDEPKHEWIGVFAVSKFHTLADGSGNNTEHGNGGELNGAMVHTHDFFDILLYKFGHTIDGQLDVFMKTEFARLGL